MDLIPAAQKDEELLADMRAAEDAPSCFHIWWLGQSGFLLKWDGQFLLFDPYLSDSLTKKYEATDKPHVRMSELCVSPGQLNCSPVVTSSHNHTDHLDADTLVPLSRVNPGLQLVLPVPNISFARERLGGATINYRGIDQWTPVEVGPWTFHGIPAAHNTVEVDDEGRCRFMGFVVEFGNHCVYHSGDTLWHDVLEEHLGRFDIDVAMLPINGNKPERRVAGNLDGKEAAELAKKMHAGIVVPCHYHMFTFNTDEPDEFVAACERLGQPSRVMRGGERLTVGETSPAAG